MVLNHGEQYVVFTQVHMPHPQVINHPSGVVDGSQGLPHCIFPMSVTSNQLYIGASQIWVPRKLATKILNNVVKPTSETIHKITSYFTVGIQPSPNGRFMTCGLPQYCTNIISNQSDLTPTDE